MTIMTACIVIIVIAPWSQPRCRASSMSQPRTSFILAVSLGVALSSIAASAAAQTPAKATPAQFVDALNSVFGKQHHGERAVHAKGTSVEGTFTPAASAASISKEPQLHAV